MAADAESGGVLGGARHWMPVEANPFTIQAYAEKLGAPLRSAGLVFSDVMGTDEVLLGMVPQPVSALMLLFPVSAASEAHRASEEAARSAAAPAPGVRPPFFMSQTIDNACGTIGLIHVVAALATAGEVALAPGSFFAKFFSETAAAAPGERALALEASPELDAEHAALAHEGQSAVVDDTHQHFIALVRGTDGTLWELDGRKAAPIPHGPTAPHTFLADAVRVVKEFMARDPDEVRFALVSLGPPPPEEDA